MSKAVKRYPLVVIGGGAAGLLAAIVAAREGVSVLVLEKNSVVGKKLSITGGGRCNITNATPIVRDLLSHYEVAGKFLFSPFSQFGVTETRAWFDAIGVPTVEQAERRVFPVSESAPAVTKALLKAAREAGVIIRTNSPVRRLERVGDELQIVLTDELLTAEAVIVATGGVSHPDTGSTGDALPWLSQLGHSVVAPQSSLVPVAVTEHQITKGLSGIALSQVGITVQSVSGTPYKKIGKVLFTHFGLSGPGILNASQSVVTALKEGQVKIMLDLLPHMPHNTLESWLIDATMGNRNKLVINILKELLPTALIKAVMAATHIDPTLPSHGLTVARRRALVTTLKAFVFTPTHVLGPESAIITSGGVVLTEVNFKTMESLLVPKLYLVGDVLNINRPSGGFSLQLCWTTGYVAGVAAANGLKTVA